MSEIARINIGEDVVKASTELGLQNRRLLDKFGVKAFNIMGAIGSGKTSLIEWAIEQLKGSYRIGVIAGDVIAEFDSARFRRHGVSVIPLNTGKECHLDAHLVKLALEEMRPEETDLLFIENVGNLICPSDFYLGEHKRVIIVSVTEGENVVAKQPAIFKAADLTIVNKVDIARFVDIDPEKLVRDARKYAPLAIATSIKTGYGLDKWLGFIKKELETAESPQRREREAGIP